jgi:hypothetical protein
VILNYYTTRVVQVPSFVSTNTGTPMYQFTGIYHRAGTSPFNVLGNRKCKGLLLQIRKMFLMYGTNVDQNLTFTIDTRKSLPFM